MNCPDYTMRMVRWGYFHLDQDTCSLGRRLARNTGLNKYLQTIASETVIWHGNGVGKRVYAQLSHDAFLCFLKKRNLTAKDWKEMIP